MKSWAWMVVLALVGAGGMACDSNPTPHPQGDATVFDARVDTAQPTGEGPDDDGDGIPDCDEAGGYWTGETCRNDIGTPDASSDTFAPEADTGDAVDGDVASEIGDGEGDVGDAGIAPDAQDSEDGQDSGPDATD